MLNGGDMRRLRSTVAAGQRAYDDANILDIHKIVVRRVALKEEHYVYRSLADAEARINERILLHINGQLATSLTLDEVKERLLIRGRNMATLQIVSLNAYRGRIRAGTLMVADTTSLQCYWDHAHPCPHCGKIYMIDETPRTFCCHDGKYQYDHPQSPIKSLEYLPPVISNLYYSRSRLFADRCVDLNNRLALSVVAVNHEHDPDPNVDRAFKIFKHNEHSVTMKGGRTYHCMKKQDSDNGLTFFITDGDLNLPDDYPQDMTRSLLREQKLNNVLLAEILEVWRRDTHMAVLKTQTQNFDVHVIKNDKSYLRKLIVKMRHRGIDGDLRKLDLDHALYEPTSYPLFFPYGEYGWNQNMKMSLYEYTKTRLNTQRTATLCTFGRLC